MEESGLEQPLEQHFVVVDRRCSRPAGFGNTVPSVVEEADHEDEYPQQEHRLDDVLEDRVHILG